MSKEELPSKPDRLWTNVDWPENSRSSRFSSTYQLFLTLCERLSQRPSPYNRIESFSNLRPLDVILTLDRSLKRSFLGSLYDSSSSGRGTSDAAIKLNKIPCRGQLRYKDSMAEDIVNITKRKSACILAKDYLQIPKLQTDRSKNVRWHSAKARYLWSSSGLRLGADSVERCFR